MHEEIKLSYSIRRATINDLDQLCHLEKASFDTKSYDLISRQSYRHLLSKGNADIIVAQMDKNTIIGSGIIFYRKNSNKARFYSLSVLPEFQGSGVGRALFESAEDYSRKKNKTEMLLEIRKDNDRLLQSYSKKGYEIIKAVPNYYPDGSACYKMKKEI